jgi:NADH dehydrogenase
MILVVGATGQLGGLIARRLLDRGTRVRILVRSGSSYDALVSAGAEPMMGDLRDAASLRPACSGVDAVVTTANAAGRGGDDTVESVDRVGNANLVDAAVAEGVRRFLFTSALGADPRHPTPFLRAKGETEARLRDSGMAWTVLQPNAYMDMWVPALVGAPALAGHPVTLVGEGRRRHSLIAMRDVAAYAIAALDHEDAECRALLLGGPQPVSWRDVVAAFEDELGREVPVRAIPPGELVPGVPEMMSHLLAAMETYDSPLEMDELAATYNVTPTPLTDFIRGVVRGSG